MLLLFVNLFLLLVGYYVLKTVRDTLILTDPLGGPEVKAYLSAGQALLLIGFVPLYGRVAARVDRVKLIFAMVVFYVVSIEVFFAAIRASVPYASMGFYIWVGIFNLTSIALFWSYANDLYRPGIGERLFPVIAIGGTAGAPLGSKIAAWLFEADIRAHNMLQIAAVLLLVHLALYWVVNRRESRRQDQETASRAPVPPGNGFALVLASPYLRIFALLLIVLNVVNTNGNYVLEKTLLGVAAAAANAAHAVDQKAFVATYVGSFVGNPALPGARRVSAPRGVLAITRHPMMWSFAIWAVVHLALVATLKAFLLDGAILLLALGGAIGQDAKKSKLMGARWHEWAAQTSFMPFARGLKSPGAFALVGGTALFLAATWLHPIPVGIWRWIG